MTTQQLVTARDVAPTLLNDFLRKMYPPEKSAFLIKHGDWWHGSNTNRIVILADGQVAGYCAVISARVWAAGQVRPALWWVDLVIAPEFRGRGLQTLFDERVRAMSDLLLGFPNELAAKIHRKHRWGVRDDLKVLLLPLRPMKVKSLRASSGWRGIILRAGSLILSPIGMLWRVWLVFQRPRRAWQMETFDPHVLADVFQRTFNQEMNTTWRDAAYFYWRYGQAPCPHEYTFCLAGSRQAPSHFLVVRHIVQDGLRYSRILDIFGDFNDRSALRDLVLLACQDSIRHGSGQVTLLCSIPELENLLRSLGFLLPSRAGFCWTSTENSLMTSFSGRNHWVLADSDNDAPD